MRNSFLNIYIYVLSFYGFHKSINMTLSFLDLNCAPKRYFFVLLCIDIVRQTLLKCVNIQTILDFCLKRLLIVFIFRSKINIETRSLIAMNMYIRLHWFFDHIPLKMESLDQIPCCQNTSSK